MADHFVVQFEIRWLNISESLVFGLGRLFFLLAGSLSWLLLLLGQLLFSLLVQLIDYFLDALGPLLPPVEHVALDDSEPLFPNNLAALESEHQNVPLLGETVLELPELLHFEEEAGLRVECIVLVQFTVFIVVVEVHLRKQFPHFDDVFVVGVYH